RIKVMNKEETNSPTITTIDVTLIETDLEVDIIETEIIIIEPEATLEIEIIVMIEMTTALEQPNPSLYYRNVNYLDGTSSTSTTTNQPLSPQKWETFLDNPSV
ncbi:569_t:CDS:2, partial [Gigaspora rosea]